MLDRIRASFSVAAGITAVLGISLAACGGGDETPTPIPAALRPKPATAAPLPTSTPVPTDTPEPTPSPDPATAEARRAQLPPGDEVVVQFARIENVPWEPEILAQMTPNFSLQAKGYVVYRFEGGSSEDGWYQTVITPTLVQTFVQRLADEIKVIEMAQKMPGQDVAFATNLDGSPAGTKAYGVIYVKTATEEGRLILTQEQIESPKGTYATNLKTLHELIRALEFWRRTTEQPVSPEIKQIITAQLGWWVDRRDPYTPDVALALGTRARSYLPPDAVAAVWPLDTNLAETFNVAFGETPVELTIPPQDVPPIVRTVRQQPRTFWGPLWRSADGQRFLIGVRAAVPGSNNVVIDEYEYEVPKRGMRAPGEATASPTESSGAAGGAAPERER